MTHYYRKILSRANINLEEGTLNRKPLFTQSWTCKTFNFFFKYCVESTKIVLNDIMSFSPFTQAYGFEPAFLDSLGTDYERQELEGYVRNAVLGIIGSPSSKAGWEYTTAKKGGYFQPGVSHIWARKTSHDDARWSVGHHKRWKTSDLQSLEGSDSRGRFKHTINSQRRLNDDVPFGHYGYTSLAFDVAYGIPIFNAQWPALVSVLMCYPDALKKCADSGYTWARRVEAEYEKNRPKLISSGVEDQVQRFLQRRTTTLPFIPVILSQDDERRTTQLTFGNADQNSAASESSGSTYAALAVSALAIVGASLYYYKKKSK